MIGNLLRIQRLRMQGWKIGKDVVIEPGAVLRARHGRIGDDSHIGRNCRIQAETVEIGGNCLIYPRTDVLVKTLFRLGHRCKLSRNVTIRAHKMTAGDELWCNENVDIGGGGWQKPSAVLNIGDFVHLGKDASINVCAPVTVGSCTGIGMGCMIFTHSSGNGQSILEGYKHVERPVHIGSHVSLFTRAMIAPGAVIEDGVTVAAMAYVAGKTAPGRLYAGIPAKEKTAAVPVPKAERLSALRQAIQEELFIPVSLLPGEDVTSICITEKLDAPLMAHLKRQGCQAVLCEEYLGRGKADLAVFDLGRAALFGPASKLSEQLRDALRRNGLLFTFLDYQPERLSYERFLAGGIERG